MIRCYQETSHYASAWRLELVAEQAQDDQACFKWSLLGLESKMALNVTETEPRLYHESGFSSFAQKIWRNFPIFTGSKFVKRKNNRRALLFACCELKLTFSDERNWLGSTLFNGARSFEACSERDLQVTLQYYMVHMIFATVPAIEGKLRVPN